jgi:hypothetical protein
VIITHNVSQIAEGRNQTDTDTMKETDTNTDTATFENGTAHFGNLLLYAGTVD